MQMGDGSGSDTSATSPVIQDLANGTAQLKLSWQPEAINLDGPTTFTFEFVNASTGEPLQNVTYSVHLSLNGTSMGHAHEGEAREGIGTVEQEFDSMGSLSIVIESIRIGDAELEDLVQVTITVVPEFPVVLVGVIMTATLALSLLATRFLLNKNRIL